MLLPLLFSDNRTYVIDLAINLAAELLDKSIPHQFRGFIKDF